MPPAVLARFLDVRATPEGWIFGVDRANELADLSRKVMSSWSGA
jgi:hypothetical protein